MKTINYLFTLGSILFFLSSCDPVADYDKSIRNSTDNQLRLLRSDAGESTDFKPQLADSTLVAPNSRQVLFEGFDIGGTIDQFADCPGFPEEGDTLFIQVVGQESEGFQYELTQSDFEGKYRELSKGSCECVFEITQELLDGN